MAKKPTTNTSEPRLLFAGTAYNRSQDLDGRANRYSDKRLRHHCGLVRRLSRLVEKEGWMLVMDAYEILCDINKRIPATMPPDEFK
jgi:hypothetical protein